MAPKGMAWRPAAIVLLAGLAGLSGCAPSRAFATAALPACSGFGITYPSPLASVSALEARVGCRFASLRWYQDWNTSFDLERARAIVGRKAEPQLSWQPMLRGPDGRARGVPYGEIARGEHDAYLRRFASGVRQLGRRISIAFAPEMNGNWVPYSLNAENTARDFVAAHQRIYRVFRDARADVRWVWTPNVLHPTQTASFAELFPGEAYVDTLGLDGYNWGTTRPYTRWQSFEVVFGPSIGELARLSAKPIEIVEFASADAGGNKAAWIRDMCRSVARQPRIARLDWFQIDNSASERVDWRLDSSPGALEAFAACVRERARPTD